MDDFQMSGLNETKNEYSALLVSKITPCIIQGIYSIYKEALKLCVDNEEDEKYLMTFQNFLSRVTKWNQEIVNKETERIQTATSCSYLEDLLTCVHITQLKILTTVRVGKKQKKIDIDIPKLNDFIHQVYIEVARRIYKNVYLFEKDVIALQKQKNLREVELIVKECIIEVIRNNMPVETILRAYLDETVEDDVEEVKEEVEEILEPTGEVIEEEIQEEEKPVQEEEKPIKEEIKEEEKPVQEEIKEEESMNNIRQGLSFNDNDTIKEYNTKEDVAIVRETPVEKIDAPKSIERLEELSEKRWEERRAEEESDEEDDYYQPALKISNENINLGDIEVQTIQPENVKLNNDSLLDDVMEIL
jgi:ElaB/YqjD/DUF883 family membrane-anchored ribosome-binding protein